MGAGDLAEVARSLSRLSTPSTSMRSAKIRLNEDGIESLLSSEFHSPPSSLPSSPSGVPPLTSPIPLFPFPHPVKMKNCSSCG